MTSNRATILTATYRIVTPMFCAGADQHTAELRLPSFKGALRFWWRSLMWDKVKDHRELNLREAQLFGASDAGAGQSKVRMRLIECEPGERINQGDTLGNGLTGATYLGYGVMNSNGVFGRQAIANGHFTVECRFSRLCDDSKTEEVRRALILLGTIGGLGSKSRKGYGSLTITELTGDTLEPDPSARLASVFAGKSLGGNLPDWTSCASSEHRRVVKVTSGHIRPVELLNAIGREQVLFRSWGNRGRHPEHRTLDRPSEQNFNFDHDLFKRLTSGDYPHRVAFGLPHSYGKYDDQKVSTADKRLDRRASPLFIHIDQFSDDVKPSALLTFLPSQFLADGQKISAFGREVVFNLDDSFWYPIHGFLDRLTSDGSRPADRSGYHNFPKERTWWKKDDAGIHAQEVQLD